MKAPLGWRYDFQAHSHSYHQKVSVPQHVALSIGLLTRSQLLSQSKYLRTSNQDRSHSDFIT